MAITDNVFTADEIEAAVTANPSLLDTVLGTVRKRGYDPLNQADKDKFTQDTETRVIGAKSKELWDEIDKVAVEAGGVQKQANEKTSDFVKRLVSSFRGDATGRAAKITELEKAIAEGAGDKTMQAQLEALQASDADKTEKLTKAEKANFQKDVLLDVRVALLGFKYDPNLKDSVRDVMVQQATQKVVDMASTEKAADGTERLVFLRGGKVVLGEKNQPASADYLLREELKDILDEGQKGNGTGSTGGRTDGGTDDKGAPVAPTTLPQGVKTRHELSAHLLKLGLAAGSKDYETTMDKLGKGLPIR